jgi:hypothetical protein
MTARMLITLAEVKEIVAKHFKLSLEELNIMDIEGVNEIEDNTYLFQFDKEVF